MIKTIIMTRHVPSIRRLHVHFFPSHTRRARHLLSVSIFANAVASAMPLDETRLVYRNSDGSSSSSISANVWIPIMVVTITLVVLMFLVCLKRSMRREVATARRYSATSDSTAANQNTSSNQRRRPRRTASQISTKSLPPYMKEPGDHELVIYRGPLEMVDQPPNSILPLGDVEENSDPSMTHFNISLDRVVSRDTLPDGSTAHLVRGVARGSVDLRSLESSLQSHSTNSELLVSHQRTLSRDSDLDLRGEAPPYSEEAVVSGDPSALPPPQPPIPPEPGVPVPQPVHATPGNRRSRFGFLLHPFSSHTPTTSTTTSNPRTAAPATHARSGSAHTLASTEHTSASRPMTPNNASRSSLLALRGIRTRASSAGSAALSSPSMISLHSISAPLPHTLTRTEFRIPRGGLTPEQVKLITSRDAPERFGRPYGSAAVAFAGSRVLLASDAADTPPPEFDEAVGATASSGVDATAAPDRAGESEEHEAGTSSASSSSPASHVATPTSSRHTSLTSERQQAVELSVNTQATSTDQAADTSDLDEAVTSPTARPLSVTPAVQDSTVVSSLLCYPTAL